jgi:hypothetical protein
MVEAADGLIFRQVLEGEGADIWDGSPSPDGSQILVHRHLGWLPRENQIALVPVRDGSQQLLKTLDWRYPMNLSLSPDGKHVVYDFPAGEHPSNHDIFMLSVDNRQVTPLISHPANDYVLHVHAKSSSPIDPSVYSF